MNNQEVSHLKKKSCSHVQFLDIDCLLVLSIHPTALIILDSDGLVSSSSVHRELSHLSFYFFPGVAQG